jgi:hypothetical protein
MLNQKLQPRIDLRPGRRGEQWLGVRAIAERRLFEAEEGFPQ